MKLGLEKISGSITSNVLLAPFTTLGIGGEARVFIDVASEEDLYIALVYAREKNLPLRVLGAGSNILVPDDGVAGIVIRLAFREIFFQEYDDGEFLVASAGALWEDVVDSATSRGLFGIENLAGIPGTLGGAVVQNIGAYGAEVSDVFEYADVIDKNTGEMKRITHADADFSYRSSFFKKHTELVIAKVSLRLASNAPLNISYPDLKRACSDGVKIDTPADVAHALRAIRSEKLPTNANEGTAGSFFKNPIISQEKSEELKKRFPDMPAFKQEDDNVKISLAWLFDHALSLKGYTCGNVRLYEHHPIVLITLKGATAKEVDTFANDIEQRALNELGITIEREVETFKV